MGKIIDCEAHFLTREFIDCVDNSTLKKIDLWYDKLFDLGDGRLRDMDEAGIDTQVLSFFQAPHIQGLDPAAAKTWSRNINEELAGAVEKHTDRFIGLATIPVQSPDEAARELERAVLELGLKGACLLSNARGKYFDSHEYWEVFETAEKLDVPIYLHPTSPSAVLAGAYAGYDILSGPPHGFSSEVSLHALRLIYSGLFDKHPRLRIILGHMGEGLPFWLSRIDFGWQTNQVDEQILKKPSEYIKRNFTITTSGMFFQPAFICAYLALGSASIAFAVDYPPEDSNAAVEFMKAAPICDSDKEKILHSNAEALFKL